MREGGGEKEREREKRFCKWGLTGIFSVRKTERKGQSSPSKEPLHSFLSPLSFSLSHESTHTSSSQTPDESPSLSAADVSEGSVRVKEEDEEEEEEESPRRLCRRNEEENKGERERGREGGREGGGGEPQWRRMRYERVGGSRRRTEPLQEDPTSRFFWTKKKV